MNTFKGTPGEFAQDGFNLLAVIAKEDEGQWRKIADCTISHDTDIEVEKANCKLFSASKKMMEALQAILSIQEENPSKPGTFWVRGMPTHEMLTNAKAALSAALD